jgi:ribosomal protein L7/L12
MDYGLVRSILNTIPTSRASAYTVTDPETLGDFLLALSREMTALQVEASNADLVDYLRRQVNDLQESADDWRTRAVALQQEVTSLKFQVKFPGETLEGVADKVWASADHDRGLIPPIKELRSLTGIGLRESKEAIEAARDRHCKVNA